MGRVFAARDLKLGRDVAIKVLGTSSFDEQQVRRFELEARGAGALNHPNIVAVYDIGWNAGAPYIVSELLQGTTLRHRLEKKQLPVRQAIDYELQLARGLAAAHDKGVIHRDLKPENVFVTSEGRLKILDFGIAKLVLPEAPGATLPADEARAATPPRRTDTGLLMGTMGYMSPEQLRGKHADHRTDIFSAGAMLYEMLAGAAPFERATPVETGTATLNDEPPELPARVPLELDRIVQRCLEKSPDDRYQSAKDLALDLEAAAAHPLARPRRRWWMGAVGVFALIALTGILAFLTGRRGAPEPARFRQLTFRRGNVESARFTPDGQAVVYSAAREGESARGIYSLRLQNASPEPTPLKLVGRILAISHSEKMLIASDDAFSPGTMSVSPAGGAPHPVLEGVIDADWAPDGSGSAVVRRVAGRVRLEYPAGKVLFETAIGDISHPRFSRKGDLIAFRHMPVREFAPESVEVVDLAGNHRTLAGGFPGVSGLAWSPTGEEVWFGVDEPPALRAVSLSGRQRLLVQVPGTLQLLDVHREGRALVSHGTFRHSIAVLPPGEEKEREISWLDSSRLMDLSADGRTILFSSNRPGCPIRSTSARPTARPPSTWAMGTPGDFRPMASGW